MAEGNESVQAEKPKRKHTKLTAIIVAVVIVALAGIGGGYAYYTHQEAIAYHEAVAQAEAADKALSDAVDDAMATEYKADQLEKPELLDKLNDAIGKARELKGIPEDRPGEWLAWQLAEAEQANAADADEANAQAEALNAALKDVKDSKLAKDLDDAQAQLRQGIDSAIRNDETNRTKTEQYVNARFAYAIDIPEDFVWQRESDNGDGRKFTNDRLGMTITVWGAFNASNASMDDLFDSNDPTLVYKAEMPGEYVASWEENGMITYQHQLYAPDVLRTVEFTYPSSQRDSGDQIVEQVSSTFESTQSTDSLPGKDESNRCAPWAGSYQTLGAAFDYYTLNADCSATSSMHQGQWQAVSYDRGSFKQKANGRYEWSGVGKCAYDVSQTSAEERAECDAWPSRAVKFELVPSVSSPNGMLLHEVSDGSDANTWESYFAPEGYNGPQCSDGSCR